MNVALIGYAQSGRSTLYRAAARGLAKGDVTATHVAWSHAKSAPNTPSLLVAGDELYFVSDGGVPPPGTPPFSSAACGATALSVGRPAGVEVS